MAKDPAFLFYHEDFFAGVSDLSNDEVGAYIRCLCIQASKGGVSEKHMKKICETHDVFMIVVSKFKINSQTNLFENFRLTEEITKRRNYSKSRSDNRKGSKKDTNISESYDKHMVNEDENVIDIVSNRKGGKGEKPLAKKNIPEWIEFLTYAITQQKNVDHLSLKMKYEAWKVNDWKDGYDKPIKNWKSKLLNTMPHLKQTNENGKSNTNTKQPYRFSSERIINQHQQTGVGNPER